MKELINNWKTFLTEDQQRTINVFLDMDGVLVDFPSALKDYITSVYSQDPEVLHPESKSSRRVLHKLQNLQLTNKEIENLYDRAEDKFQSGEPYERIEKIMSNYTLKALLKNKNLWLSMNKLENADDLVDLAFKVADNVFVLSAGVDESSEAAKKEWIGHHFPQIEPQNVNIDRHKGQRLQQLAANGTISLDDLNILIDDRNRFLQDFEEAGGTGIKYDFEHPGEAIAKLQSLKGENQ